LHVVIKLSSKIILFIRISTLFSYNIFSISPSFSVITIIFTKITNNTMTKGHYYERI